MVHVMVFIDDDWLERAASALSLSTEGVDLDRRRLAKVVGEEAAFFLRTDRSDLVRTFVFRTVTPEERSAGQPPFATRFYGETFLGSSRGETCAAFAASLCGYAAVPYAYDIAVAVTGNADLVPALRQARRLGKRVVVASVEDLCDAVYREFSVEPIRDADIIWLADIVPQVSASSERYAAECQSPLHQGSRKVWTEYPPRKGRPFYCDDCRRRFAEQQRGGTGESPMVSRRDNGGDPAFSEQMGEMLAGEICKVVRDKGYGFVKGSDGREFFFHLSDLHDLSWEEIDAGMRVSFFVKREPEAGRAGAAGRVMRAGSQEPEVFSEEKKMVQDAKEEEVPLPSVG